MNDSQLIQEYASCRSDDAFKALIDQYVGLVYSACLRQLKDRHLAEDATQAVFILLSQKAGGLNQTYLTGWLVTTARYACANIRRSQQRRQNRERVVAMNQSTITETPNDDLLDLLDEALCHLNVPDREALVLRYLEEQSIGDVAVKLGVSPEAARKRVERGVEKLRQYFSRRGITTSSASLGPLLAEQLRGAALTPVARQAIAQGVFQVFQAGGHSTAASVAIAKGTKITMLFAQLKITAGIALIAGVLGTSGWIISRVWAESSPTNQTAPAIALPPPTPVASAPAAALPTTLPAMDLSTPEKTFVAIIAALKAGDRGTLYRCLWVDPNREPLLIDRVLDWNLAINRMLAAARQAYGPEAASQLWQGSTIDTVMAIMAATGPGKRTITSDTAVLSTEVPPGFLAILPSDAQHVVSLWSGAPIRFKKQAGDWKLDIDRSLRVEMHNGPTGATEEDQALRNASIERELRDAANQEAGKITAGRLPTIANAVRAWSNAIRQLLMHYGLRGVDMKILPAEAETASTTDDSAWEFYSDTPSVYFAAMDPNTLHNGHATLRLGSDVAVRTQTGNYQRIDRLPELYLDHRIRVTAWIKSTKVLSDAGIRIRARSADGNVIADEGQRKQRPVRGTTDWNQYTAYMNVPADAVSVQWGVILNGSGYVWIDLESVRMEIADGMDR